MKWKERGMIDLGTAETILARYVVGLRIKELL
jgi:hypothetical protein